MKQADVVLLGFPMMYPMSPEVRRNDLEMYEPVTEQDGPAMTWVSSQAELFQSERAEPSSWLGKAPGKSALGRPWWVPCLVLFPAEHVCSRLDGAEGGPEGTEPTEQVLQQHH